MSLTTDQKIKLMHEQARDAERKTEALEQTARMLSRLDEEVVRARRHQKSMGHGLTAQDGAARAAAVSGMNDIEARGYGQFVKRAGVDAWGWCWVRSKELRERIEAYRYSEPIEQAIAKRFQKTIDRGGVTFDEALEQAKELYEGSQEIGQPMSWTIAVRTIMNQLARNQVSELKPIDFRGVPMSLDDAENTMVRVAHPADSEAVTKRVAGEPVPAPATTRHAPGEVRTKSFKMQLPTPHDVTLPDRTFQAIISTADIDSDGEVVMPDGMDYSRFEGNPRLLLEHDQSKPIGRVVELERVDEGWRMTATLTPRPADFVGAWLADDAWHRISSGELAAISIAFLPTKSRDEYEGEQRVVVHDEWELVEVSVVPVGANPRARITGIGVGNRTSAAA